MTPSPASSASPPLRRAYYFDGQNLRASDFLADRSNLDTLRKLYNTRLHSAGIAAGLVVSAGDDLRSVRISPGMAVQPSGQEALVTSELLAATPDLGGESVNLFILSTLVRTDLSQASMALGYKRLTHQAMVSFVRQGENVDSDAIFLGQVVLSEAGEVAAIETMGRQPCGFDVGGIDFVDPASGAVKAGLQLSADVAHPGLSLNALNTRVIGSMQVAGGLSVGLQAPRATLDVESSETVLLRAVAMGNVPVMTVQGDGHSSIGSATPDPSARLTVAGDLEIDSGNAIQFDGAAALQAAAPSNQIALGGLPNSGLGGGLMQISDAGRIDLYTGAGALGQAASPTLTLLATGEVGVGTASPANALVVNGSLRCLSGGYDFGDGVVQTTAAISTTVGIGGIIEWWSGDGKLTLPPQFVLCNGGVINDPLSPLNGQTTPNLVNHFIMGTTEFGQIGAVGGSATHTHQVESWPIHTHAIVHMHPSVTHSTSQDLAAGDSDTTDSKCSNTDHRHSVEIVLQDGTPTTSMANDEGIAAFATQDGSSQPYSVGLMMIMRIR